MNRIVRHELASAAGFTHASSVIPIVRSSELASGTVTQLDEPLKESAPPYLPLNAHAVFVTVPLLPDPETSLTFVPVPSLKP